MLWGEHIKKQQGLSVYICSHACNVLLPDNKICLETGN